MLNKKSMCILAFFLISSGKLVSLRLYSIKLLTRQLLYQVVSYMAVRLLLVDNNAYSSENKFFVENISSCWLRLKQDGSTAVCYGFIKLLAIRNKLATARKGSFYARTSFYLGPVASDGFTKLLFKGQCHENSMSFCTTV